MSELLRVRTLQARGAGLSDASAWASSPTQALAPQDPSTLSRASRQGALSRNSGSVHGGPLSDRATGLPQSRLFIVFLMPRVNIPMFGCGGISV